MAVFAERAKRRRAGGVRSLRAALAWLGLAMMLCLPGCGGCRKTPEAEEQEKQQAAEKAKKKEKEKDPFEAQKPAAMPSPKDHGGTCKPGHWISQVWPDVIANRGDFQGELHTEIDDFSFHKLPLVAVPYEISSQRPVALAKEQPKSLESFTWIPPVQDAHWVNFKLLAGGGGPVLAPSMGLTRMPSYRYYFVVLSKAASRYEYLDKRLDSIHVRRSEGVGPKYYEVVSMLGSRRPSLPTNALYWTSIAYLLWDDFDPAQLDVDQQQALIDWLHWGGQIIISGPDALEQLRNSFLRPYLPASVEKSRTFAEKDLVELNYWAGEGRDGPRPVKPWPGAKFKEDPRPKYLENTGHLLAERQVGRGRIVASAFRLTGPELTGWEGYDSFFNACLLRRPARVFPTEQDPRFRWAGRPAKPRLDAAKMTAVRYFARDAGVVFDDYAPDIKAALEAATNSGYGGGYTPPRVANGNPLNGGDSSLLPEEDFSIPPDKEAAPGLGAWNDFSPVAQAAREALKNASGISVPPRSFIVWVVIGYLCVLVPANWLVFRLLGRVEWAWIAAPLIAIACAALVIHLAQLNIGFARSRNEIAVIEMQPGYSRVHVARYTALYTSLATRYEFRLDGPGGQILPFPRVSSPGQFKMSMWQSRGELVCRRGDDTQLTGFSVGSNVADFMHSEEMADFGGTVTVHQDSDKVWRVTNGTKHPLDDCQAVRGGKPGGIDVGIGRLEPGATKALEFESRRRPPADNRSQVLDNTWSDDSGVGSLPNPSQATDPTGELSVKEIAGVALAHQDLRDGEICLVARVVDDVPGLTITPEAGQRRQAALLVAHLDAGPLPDPERDTKPRTSRSGGRNRDAEDPNDE